MNDAEPSDVACNCGTPDDYHWSTCALVPDSLKHDPDCRIVPCNCHLAEEAA